jgi:1-acyl-sn-glycerol-3-phosphate acyltransferase
VCNHVNLFDPFVAYSAVPQFLRGLELESHFRVPVYGWMMKSFGNVPVPVDPSPAALRAMRHRCAEALERGTSLLAFPEGHRTRTGRVGPFRTGVFRMARDLDVPVVPMTQVDAFRLQRVGSPLLRPATIVVHLHEPLRAREGESDAAFRDRVRAVVVGPLGDPPTADRNQPVS